MILRHTSRLHNFAMIALIALASYAGALSCAAAETTKPAVIHQLRIYEVLERNKEAFHARFRDHAMRIMAKYDFRIVATWESTAHERAQFVYLLEWPDEATMRERWANFMADQEWSEIKRESARTHGRLMGAIEERVLYPTEYSPEKTLLD